MSYKSIHTGQQIDAGVDAALNPDTTPTEGSNALITSGGVKSALDTFVRPNILDNANFVGGGSQQGGGQLPINQRGQVSYIGAHNYAIDRWWLEYNTNLAINADCITLSGDWALSQTLHQKVSGTVTYSALVKAVAGEAILSFDGINIFTVNNSEWQVKSFTTTVTDMTSIMVSIHGSQNSLYIKAVKLELGPDQTLAHQENGAWVLNEIPNYQQELAKCQRVYRYFDEIDIPCSNNSEGNTVRGTLPISMRNGQFQSPTFLDGYYFYGSGSYVAVSSISMEANNAVLRISATLSENVPSNLNGILFMRNLVASRDL